MYIRGDWRVIQMLHSAGRGLARAARSELPDSAKKGAGASFICQTVQRRGLTRHLAARQCSISRILLARRLVQAREGGAREAEEAGEAGEGEVQRDSMRPGGSCHSIVLHVNPAHLIGLASTAAV